MQGWPRLGSCRYQYQSLKRHRPKLLLMSQNKYKQYGCHNLKLKSNTMLKNIFNNSSQHYYHHRLNGSSSPVLTATCLSYGRLCDFLGFFFPNRPEGHTPRPILTQNGSNDVDSRKDVPFGVKIATFWNPWPQDPQNRQNLPNFGRDLENFRSISRLTLEVSRVNTP